MPPWGATNIQWTERVRFLNFVPYFQLTIAREHFLCVLPWLLVYRHPSANDLLLSIVEQVLTFLWPNSQILENHCSDSHHDQYLLRKGGIWTVLWMMWNILGNLVAQKQIILVSEWVLCLGQLLLTLMVSWDAIGLDVLLRLFTQPVLLIKYLK